MEFKRFISCTRKKISSYLRKNLFGIHYLKDSIAKSILLVEVIIAVFLILGVIIGVIHLGRFLIDLYVVSNDQIFIMFHEFLDHLLLLIIGLELIIMLIKHNAGSVIEVLLFAVAREILIHSVSMIEILLGIVALAMVLAARKYLLINNLSGDYFGYILGAAVDVDDVNRLMNIHLPLEKAKTLGGFIFQLANRDNKNIKMGLRLKYKNVEFEILDVIDGVIEKIRVSKVD
jgi:hypothetical protein